jgi:bacterioferritin-associated ferredoxin
MIVCSCEAVNDRTIRTVIASGAATVEDVTGRCRAGGGCGGCHRLLERLLADCRPEPQSPAA